MGYIEDIRRLVGHRPLILVGATALISDEAGRILLQKRRFPKDCWGIPGGLMELGESTEETAKREVREETGLHIDNLKLLGVYTGLRGLSIAHNGDQYQPVTIAYYTQNYHGKLVTDPEESLRFEFRALDDLPDHILNNHCVILNDFLAKMKSDNNKEDQL
ncbi:NUDIX domain-containing protein [Sporolactobacillus shoreae]|uniref:NUDIX domain-containing protein n=1 Tax=Sporolactobacillus shoreae TaxID=1465501 RepID=A0A4Z0GMF2_9BACL|nr:NUDIX hydrolase [Sporolactobacillus shoreae]TGA98188.1 NUDIX domain-containing protein [Sporolactobacillus shoreae]